MKILNKNKNRFSFFEEINKSLVILLCITLMIVYISCSKNNIKPKIIIPEVITLAGNIEGYTDGTGVDALFAAPYGIAIDSQGIVYVTDEHNHSIRRISSNGVVSTLAGNGISGFADGIGVNAQFNSPVGITVDLQGNVYVADINNHKIRKITSNGTVSTLAGSTKGFADATGLNAKFNHPSDVVVDGQNNVYVTDLENHKIRKITASGVVSTLAGSEVGFADGSAAEAQFNSPIGIAIDSQNNVIVADLKNHKIRKITPLGVVSTLAGSIPGYVDGTDGEAQFAYPFRVAIDNQDNIYISDSANHKIRKRSLAGVVSTLTGSTAGFKDGKLAEAQFRMPTGIAIDTQGNIYVSDTENHKIRRITQN